MKQQGVIFIASNEERQIWEKVLRLDITIPFPEPLPEGIRCIERHDLARVWRVQKNQYRGLLVLADISIKDDGRLWYHVSFSRSKSIPTYSDCLFVKNTFIGLDLWAIQVFPKQGNHVNAHPNCLHLWHCLENKPFPEFSKNGMI